MWILFCTSTVVQYSLVISSSLSLPFLLHSHVAFQNLKRLRDKWSWIFRLIRCESFVWLTIYSGALVFQFIRKKCRENTGNLAVFNFHSNSYKRFERVLFGIDKFGYDMNMLTPCGPVWLHRVGPEGVQELSRAVEIMWQKSTSHVRSIVHFIWSIISLAFPPSFYLLPEIQKLRQGIIIVNYRNIVQPSREGVI